MSARILFDLIKIEWLIDLSIIITSWLAVKEEISDHIITAKVDVYFAEEIDENKKERE